MHTYKKFSPYSKTTGCCTTAKAPAAPEIIPGLPPKTEVTIPSKNPARRPTIGDKFAIKANAMASGIMANDTVIPDIISSLLCVNLR